MCINRKGGGILHKYDLKEGMEGYLNFIKCITIICNIRILFLVVRGKVVMCMKRKGKDIA